jgi:hypothetical protein
VFSVAALALGLTVTSARAITPKSAISDSNIFMSISPTIAEVIPHGHLARWIMMAMPEPHNIRFPKLAVT